MTSEWRRIQDRVNRTLDAFGDAPDEDIALLGDFDSSTHENVGITFGDLRAIAARYLGRG